MSAITTEEFIKSGSKKDQIKSLLSSGCTPTQVAGAVGCDISYISQLMAEEEFASSVVAARLVALQSLSARDSKYDSIEDQLLAGLEMKVEQGLQFWKPDAILRAIQTINAAKRRGASADQAMQAPTTVINLIMPQVAVKEYRVNAENEVIEVGGKGLVSMPARQLIDRLNIHLTNEAEQRRLEVKEYEEPGAWKKDLARRVEEAIISPEQF